MSKTSEIHRKELARTNGWQGIVEISPEHTSHDRPYMHVDLHYYDQHGKLERRVDGLRVIHPTNFFGG